MTAKADPSINDAGTRSRKYANEKRKSKKKNGPFTKFLKTPKGHLTVILLILTLVSFFVTHSGNDVKTLAISIGSALFLDFIIAIIFKYKKKFSDGGLLTGFIIGLVLSPTAPWYVIVSATAIAIISKHLIKAKRKPIFNPAGVGLLAVIYLYSAPESWWGGLSLLPVWFSLLVIVTGLFLNRKINKLPMTFTFLGSYFVIFLILVEYFHFSGMSGIFRVPYLNSVLFLGFFMLTDPPTSAVKTMGQVFYGVFAAVVSAAAYIYLGGLAYLLVGLLAANLFKFATTTIRN